MTQLSFDFLYEKKISISKLIEELEFGIEENLFKTNFYFEKNRKNGPKIDPDPDGLLVKHKKKFLSAHIEVEFDHGLLYGETTVCLDERGHKRIKSAILFYHCEIEQPKTLFSEQKKGIYTMKFDCTIDFENKFITIK